MANTIILGGDPIRMERKAAAATLLPGMLTELESNDKFQAHATAGGSVAPIIVALEDENKGGGIDTVYTINNVALCGVFRRGEKANMLLANGESAAIGSKLESNGDGYLRVVDADVSVGDIAVQSIVGTSLVVLDMSGSSGVDPASQRIAVLIA